MKSATPENLSRRISEAHHGRPGAGVWTGAMDPDTHDRSASTAAVGDPPAVSESTTEPSTVAAAAAHPTPAAASTEPSQSVGLRFEAPLLFGQKEVTFSQPHHSQDLIGLYRVTATAKKVARIDPATGEKINKLRSSYQNHIKSFQLAGRNKPIKHDENSNGMSLREMAAWPEEEWNNQKVSSKEVSKGLSSSALAKLEMAVKLEPGPVPKNDEWESILGHEKVKTGIPASPPADIESKHPSYAPKLGKANGVLNGSVPPATDGEAIRARRTGKRRRYDDESFEGYGEGYVDDDREEADGLSSDGGAKKKKRRKEINSAESATGLGYGIGVHQQSIGRGIGAFGGR